MRTDEIRRRLYDPDIKEGDIGPALQTIEVYSQENPIGISSAIFEYKAKVMRDLGMPEEARAAEKIAKTLKSPAPSGKKARARKP